MMKNKHVIIVMLFSASLTVSEAQVNNHEQIINNLVSNMVLVEGGAFSMGASSIQDSNAFFDEQPVHEVTLSSFYIGRYEVTQEEWEAVMGESPLPEINKHLRDGKSPAWHVTWTQCQQFTKKLCELTGKRFRLPTEAEWEYAAKGGNKSKGFKYAGSNDVNMVGWSGEMMRDNRPCRGGRLKPNELGLYDMSGNVGEWCQDTYGDHGYQSHSKNNPCNDTNGMLKVVRGGNHYDSGADCRVAKRNPFSMDGNLPDTGLRLVMETDN